MKKNRKDDTNKLVKRTYYVLQGQLASPLHAGSGEDDFTNMDVLRNYKHEPFIAGTAIAGSLRHWLIQQNMRDVASGLFGAEMGAEKEFHQSRIFVSDVVFPNADIMIRDHVKLENKVAVFNGKFDVEVIATGTNMEMRLEIIQRNNNIQYNDDETMQLLIDAIHNGDLTIGGKTNRGYGKVTITKVQKKTFHYSTDIEEWLNWDWNEFDSEEKPNAKELDNMLSVGIRIKDTLLIRDVKNTNLDYSYVQMNGKPVIPGTTWAGAFKQRLQVILKDLGYGDNDKIILCLFGEKHDEGKPSILKFEESIIEGGKPSQVTRNAIDRFSGATIAGALFTGESLYQGETTLVIRWDNTRIETKEVKGILYWLLRDLNEGLLAIGGETAVGRGVMGVTTPIESYGKEAITYIKGVKSK